MKNIDTFFGKDSSTHQSSVWWELLAKYLWGSKPALAAWQFWAGVAHPDMPCDTVMPRQCQKLGFSVSLLGCLAQREEAACFCQHRAPYAKGMFCYVPITWLQLLHTVQATYAGMKSLKYLQGDPHLLLLTHHPSLWASPVYFGQETAPGSAGPRYLISNSVQNTLTKPDTVSYTNSENQSLRCVKITQP